MATNPAVRQQEGFLTFIFAVCTTALVQNFAQTLQYDPCDSPAARELQSSSRTNEGAFFDFTGQCVDFLNWFIFLLKMVKNIMCIWIEKELGIRMFCSFYLVIKTSLINQMMNLYFNFFFLSILTSPKLLEVFGQTWDWTFSVPIELTWQQPYYWSENVIKNAPKGSDSTNAVHRADS